MRNWLRLLRVHLAYTNSPFGVRQVYAGGSGRMGDPSEPEVVRIWDANSHM